MYSNKDPPPHIVLGIDKNSNEKTIKQSYKQLAKKFHPDKYQGNKKYANHQFSKIDEAYKKMISPQYKQNQAQTQNGGMFLRPQPRNSRQPRFNPPQPSTGPTVLCNGTVLMSNGFHPAQMNYETLQQLRRNIR